jgi:signal transduction histidine kinase/streptogramin lyase
VALVGSISCLLAALCRGQEVARHPADPLTIGVPSREFVPQNPAPSRPLSLPAAGYLLRRWGVINGLPADESIAVTQTSDGYVWVSFMTGLAKFDGDRFIVFRPGRDGLPPGIVQRFHQDGEGRLLAVREDENPLVMYDGHRFHTLGANAMVDSNTELTATTFDGTLWKLNKTDGQVSRLSNNRFVPDRKFDPSLGTIQFFGVEGDQPWMIADLRLYRLSAEGAVPCLIADGARARVQSDFFRDPNGALLIVADQAIHRLKGPEVLREMEMPNTGPMQKVLVCMDRFGNLWSHGRGHAPELLAYFMDGTVARSSVGRSGKVTQVIADDEGNVWAACRDGLIQSVPVPFQTPDEFVNLPNKHLVSMTSDQAGRLWIVNDWHLSIYSPDSRSLINLPNLFIGEGSMGDSALSRDGSMWIAEWAGSVARVSADEYAVLQHLDLPQSIPQQPATQVYEDGDGTLWVIAGGRIWRAIDGEITQAGLPDALQRRESLVCAEDPAGRFHVAAIGAIFRREQSGWIEESLPMDAFSPMGLAFAPDGTGWWLGISSSMVGERTGLAFRRNNTWTFLETNYTSLDCRAFGLAIGADDALWVSTSERGLFRFSRSNLVHRADDLRVPLQAESFNQGDGMPSSSCNEFASRGLHVKDGRVWVSTVAGPTSLDPERLKRIRALRAPPRTRIQEVLVDDQIQSPQPDPDTSSQGAPLLVLPARAHRVEIRYTGIHLTTPSKVRFRYRLSGYEDEWVEAGSRRTAFYQNLPPADYRFEVMSSLGPGLWRGEMATLRIRALPVWWQTTGFRLTLGALAGGVIAFTRSVKARRLRRERLRREEFARRLIESQEAERKRIAAELHDSMGQNLLIAKNQLYLLQETRRDSVTESRLKQVADSVASALDEARSISHQLRPFQLERLGLTRAIASMLKQTSESTRLPIHSRVQSVDGLLPAESEVMIYRILQEALSNIVKHADASEAHVTVETTGRHIRVVVQDDGRGFDIEKLAADGNASRGLGMAGFHERANLLRGQFRCQTSPGAGATLIFDIPIPIPNSEPGPHETKGARGPR